MIHSAPFLPDDRQRRAIEHVHGPMLVVAGAGTGKTSVLIHRIARLIREGHAQPEEMVALTYTLASAKEMRERVMSLVGKPIHSATFHDYCLGLLACADKKFDVLEIAIFGSIYASESTSFICNTTYEPPILGSFSATFKGFSPVATTNWSRLNSTRRM